MTTLDEALRRLCGDFEAIGLQWALVDGLAVSARAEPRTTRDVDIAVAAEGDDDAERAVLAMRQRGYRDAGQMVEHQVTGRLATLRMVSPVKGDVVVDLIFASTGIEREIVAAATPIDVLPGATVPVASLGHLLAMKALAGRLQDVADFSSLLHYANAGDVSEAREALRLIRERGTHRQKDLQAEFDRLQLASESERQGGRPRET